ncbi:MAG: hypothetical protein SP1CHLAM54_07010 [Chlamydiia bacterium]|nr:hypothetical protein [Chlamydiia bacterium]MCH9615607.1 hypothetical protein [Chlamydiia bacterium]MCH9628990.1 hypothetical protein [Chlamydiia bacterium]
MKKILMGLLALLCVGCGNNGQLDSLCKGATAKDYDPTFQIWCPEQASNAYVPVEYGCIPRGKGVSPPIKWSGLPEGTTHLRITVADATCTYECNGCCKFHHWVLDLPIAELEAGNAASPSGIRKGAAALKEMAKYTLPNSMGKKAYFPWCPPLHQTHAYIYQAIAYKLEGGRIEVTGRSQSKPLLFSLQRRK